MAAHGKHLPSAEPSQRSIERWENEGGAIRTMRAKRPRDPNQLAKAIIGIATGQVEDREPKPEEQGKNPKAVAAGERGGRKRAEVIGPARRSEIARAAAKRRWKKVKA